MGKLKAAQVEKLGDGRHADGDGLYLHVRGGSRSWFFRYQTDGKRRELTLGRWPTMSLREARDARFEAARLRDAGIDPVEARRRAAAEAAVERPKRTVAAMTAACFDAEKGKLKGEGKAGRWMSPIETHILPKLGDKDVTTLTAGEVRDVLRPIWRTKPSASEKALQRLGIILRHAAAEFPGEVDLMIVPNARTLLGSQEHMTKNIPSMPWTDLPEFYSSLGATPTDLALRLLILTAARSRPARLAHVDHFDGDTWYIRAELMKNSEPFRLPLSLEAQRVIDLARPLARNGFLFCGPRGKPISDMAMNSLMKRRKLEYRPHGFRSSFRVWCEETGEDWTLAEISLAHSIGNKVERSYQRSDLLDRRRPLLDRWAAQVCSERGAGLSLVES